MKLIDLIKKQTLTQSASKSSKSSSCSRSKTLYGSGIVASPLINKINKSSNCSKSSYICPFSGKGKANPYRPAATATPATHATGEKAQPINYISIGW